MARGVGQADEILYGATPVRARSSSGITVHNCGRDRFFAEPPSPSRLAQAAQAIALFGSQVHAKGVYAEFERDVHGVADSRGVEIYQTPADLPFMEHPDMSAPSRRTLIDNIPIYLAKPRKGQRLSPLEGALQFVKESNPRFARIKFEDDRELVINGSAITLYHKVPRRWLGHKTEVLERVQRPR